jgi:hypothetical protein
MHRAGKPGAGLAFADASSGHVHTCFRRNPVSHAIEPTANRLAFLNRRRLPSQDEEGGLKRVLGIVFMAKHTAADAQHHPAVPFHQGSESGFLAVSGEALEQLRIGQIAHSLRHSQLPNMAENRPQRCLRHDAISTGDAITYIYVESKWMLVPTEISKPSISDRKGCRCDAKFRWTAVDCFAS